MDRLAICNAYYHVASRYHSGQSSKGYAILSRLARLDFNPGLGLQAHIKDSDLRRDMACLLWTRRREIRRTW